MKVYIAGPMTGLPNYNFPKFNRVAEQLRNQGFEVVNPAEINNIKEELAWSDYMKRAISAMLTCDAILLLLDWEKSRGASLELHIAKCLGMVVYHEELQQSTAMLLS